MVQTINLIINIVQMNFYIIKSKGFELLTDIISNCKEQQDIVEMLDVYDKLSSNSIFVVLYVLFFRFNC